MKRRATIISFLLATSVLAHAENQASLQAKPSLCIIDRRFASCDMEIELQWQASRTSRYCLIRQRDTLQCWESAKAGDLKEAMKVSAPVRYNLADAKRGNEIQASVLIEVLRITSKDRRQNRRSRHVWDLL